MNCCLIRRGCVKLGVRRGRQWRPFDPTRPPLTLRRQEAIEVSVVPSPAVRLERQGAFLSRTCGARRIRAEGCNVPRWVVHSFERRPFAPRMCGDTRYVVEWPRGRR